MARGSPPKWLNVLGPALVAIVFAGSGCSHTSAPSRANSSAPAPLATAASPQSSPAGPACGVTITGRHRYLAPPPARNAVLLLGAGPRGIVLGAQANGGICQVLPIAQQPPATGNPPPVAHHAAAAHDLLHRGRRVDAGDRFPHRRDQSVVVHGRASSCRSDARSRRNAAMARPR
jgi:hypothetical protein